MPNHPFAEFLLKIARDPAALNQFLDNPEGDPDASALLPQHRAALVRGVWREIKSLLVAENRDVEREFDQTLGAVIGWNMLVLLDDIHARGSAQP